MCLPLTWVYPTRHQSRSRFVEWGIGTYMAVTGPGINAGLGESGLSEKGENAEMRALADEGCLRGARTAIIMATYATGRRRE
jgi:hypothetical protein